MAPLGFFLDLLGGLGEVRKGGEAGSQNVNVVLSQFGQVLKVVIRSAECD
jgi:hypothetical protein